MRRNNGITHKLAIPLLAVVAVVFSAVVYSAYLFANRNSLDSLQALNNSVAEKFAMNLDIVSRSAGNTMRSLLKYPGFSSQWVLKGDSVESRRLYDLMGEHVKANPYLTGVGFLFDTSAWDKIPEGSVHIPFAALSGDGYATSDLSGMQAGIAAAFLAKVKESGKPSWGAPLETTNLDNNGATLALPNERGVFFCAVSMSWFNDAANSIKPPLDGRIVALDDGMGNAILQKNALTGTGATLFVESAIPGTGWKLQVEYPRDRAGGAVRAIVLKMVVVCLVGAFLVFATLVFLLRKLSLSIRHLHDNVQVFSEGGFDIPLAAIEDGGSEIEALSEAIENLRRSVARHVEDAELRTEERETLTRELLIAKKIQADMLPLRLPSDAKFSVTAKLKTAEDFCGDFYDIVESSRGSIFIAIGDIAEKGVTAAVYMTSLISYLRAILRDGPKPSEALTLLNAELSKRMERRIFSSLLLVEFYPTTGTCIAASAGHPLPLIWQGENAAAVEITIGDTLGTTTANYVNGMFHLRKGDRVFFYTDGILGGHNAEGAVWGLEELSQNLCGATGKSENDRDVLDLLFRAIDAFRDTAAGDDMTAIVLHYR